jgi:hypothetical protein
MVYERAGAYGLARFVSGELRECACTAFTVNGEQSHVRTASLAIESGPPWG